MSPPESFRRVGHSTERASDPTTLRAKSSSMDLATCRCTTLHNMHSSNGQRHGQLGSSESWSKDNDLIKVLGK
jgi:hypothetical protein